MKNAPKRSVAPQTASTSPDNRRQPVEEPIAHHRRNLPWAAPAWFLATLISMLTVAGIGLAPAQGSATDSVQGFSNGHFDTTGNTDGGANSDASGESNTDLMDALRESGWRFPDEGQELVVLETDELCGHRIPYGDYTAPEGSSGEHTGMRGDNDPSLAGEFYLGAVVHEDNDTALGLGSDGIAMDQAGLTVHGPYACTNEATLAAGDVVGFDWRAEAAPTGDVYHVFAYLLNTATGETGMLLDAGEDPAPLPGEADDTPASEAAADGWNRAEAAVSKDGTYRVVFLSGSFDSTSNQLAGAALTIDNLTVTPAASGDETEESGDAATDDKGNEESEPESSEAEQAESEAEADDGSTTDASATASDTEDTDTSSGSVSVTGVSTAPIFTESDGTTETTDTLSDGLVAYYPFNGNANDESGNENHGIVNGDIQYVDAIIEKGIKLGGVNSLGGTNNPDFVKVTNSISLQFSDKFTITYFSRIDGDQRQTSADCSGDSIDGIYGTIAAKRGDRKGFYIMEADTSSGFSINAYVGTKGGVGADELDSIYQEFRYTAYVVDGDNVKVYINGILQKEENETIDFSYANNEDLYIGVQENDSETCFTYWYPLDGVIDELRIYNRALSETEVQTLYNEGINTSPTLTLTEPDGTDDTADTSFTITWSDEDPDSSATIALYYDTDNTGADGTLIVEGLSEDDETDAHVWDTSEIPAGAYYVYGVISDGTNDPVTAYSPGAITISHNDAPTATDDAVSVIEGESTANIHADLLANDTDPDSDALDIVSVGSAGGGTVSFDADADSLVYSSGSGFDALAAGSTATDTFSYTITDTGGLTSTATVTVTITGVNDAPSGTDGTVTLSEDTTYTLTASGFGFSDVDGNNLSAVVITTLPGNGTLQLDGTAVVAGQVIAAADLEAGNFTFTPAANDNGAPYASFTFQVQDDGGTANDGEDLDPTPNTITIDVASVNDTPTLSFTEPDGTFDTADTSYTIAWTDEDPDYNATIALYYDTDDTGADGTLIVEGLGEDDETDSYVWDTSQIPAGDYTLYAIISDGANDPVTAYSSAPLTIQHAIYQYFTPVWTDNPYNRMNLWVTGAVLDEMALSVGDEIGVFDGDICVGAGVVEETISQQNYLVITLSQDDGSGNGFTEGNGIGFRIWDASTQIETNIIEPAYFDLTTGEAMTTTPVFAADEDYIVELTAFTGSQTIELGAGWNIFSSHVIPQEDADLLNLLQPVIDEGNLVKAIDEQGGTVVELLGSWVNGIGDLAETEGYQIKVNADTALTITGVSAELPLAIPLSSGWNIIGYPVDTPQDALAAVQPLIDEGSLVKVIDEQGNTVVDFLGSWVNLIGDLAPGEGYKLKVGQDTTLTIEEGSEESMVSASRLALLSSLDGVTVSAVESISPEHFTPIWTGNPYDRMNLWVTSARLNDTDLAAGDEIGVFDGEDCVGAGVVESTLSQQNYLTIVTSKDDGTGNGFTEGNGIDFRIWDSSAQTESTAVEPVYFDLSGNSISTPAFTGNGDYVVNLSAVAAQATPINETISLNRKNAVGLGTDGTAMVAVQGTDWYGATTGVDGWSDLAQVSAGYYFTAGLGSDGTVLATDGWDNVANSTSELKYMDATDWEGIAQIAAGYAQIMGLTQEGTLVAAGPERMYREKAFLGGTVVAGDFENVAGSMYGVDAQDVFDDLQAANLIDENGSITTNFVELDDYHDLDLTLSYSRSNKRRIYSILENASSYEYVDNIAQWNEGILNNGDSAFVQVVAGDYHFAALRADGTVVASGKDEAGRYDGVEDWQDITQLCAGMSHTVGLKTDGTLVVADENADRLADLADWNDAILAGESPFIQVSAGYYQTIALRADGTVAVSSSYGSYDQVGNWTNITQVSAGGSYVVGITADNEILVDIGNSDGVDEYIYGTSLTEWASGIFSE
uniref:Alpha-tubulin suppressor n=1 Tax=Candidatus Kentrum sp. FM TaxID=2126340 RepID=A0A450S4L1_9GAMM|nr:MAG: Alpha-tubulin suppressor [Candidatus Kentron sp. FM]